MATVAVRRRPAELSDGARQQAGLSHPDLWLRYFELGGMHTSGAVEAFLRHGAALPRHEQNVLAQALRERFSELGDEHPRQYREAGTSRRASSRSPACGQVELQLLGSFSVHTDDDPMPVAMSSQRLVCFLALHDGLLLRQHVAGSLWGDTTERRSQGSLRSALWRLGQSPHPLVEVVGAHLRLSDGVRVDLSASERLAYRVLDRALNLHEAELDSALLSMDLLPDWTEEWVLVKRDHHTQLRLRALEALSLRLSEMRRFGEAVQTAMLAVAREPLRESAQRTLVQVHLAEGNVAAAMKQYASFRELLHEELNLEPSTEMKGLVRDPYR